MKIDHFRLFVTVPRVDPAATNNIAHIFEMWKNVNADSTSETVRPKMTFLTTKLHTISSIILANKPEDQNIINVKMMECLL